MQLNGATCQRDRPRAGRHSESGGLARAQDQKALIAAPPDSTWATMKTWRACRNKSRAVVSEPAQPTRLPPGFRL